ncbi:MAG: phage tail protein, partial [Clostridia bacterium]|nr:phage tail protein [Clostridia bacterium]
STSMENSYTRLFPYALKDGTLTTITSKTIPVTNTAGIAERVLVKDFTSFFEEGETISAATLLTEANTWLQQNDINTPEINVTVSFIHLWQSPEYESLSALEKVSLCDTVKVYHSELGIDITTKVIKTVYDSLGEKYEKIELGTAKANFGDTITQKVNEATAGLADEWKDDIEASQSAITQAYNAAIDAATKAITGYSGGYVVLNPSEHPQELLVMNSADKNSATKLWRWNLGGLGYSNNGYNGPYTTAITMNGEIVADFITAGTLTANIIKAGVLSDANGNTSFNLNTGLLTTANINVTGGTIRIGSNLYYTVITNGSIAQYGASDGTRVGGLTPLQSGNKFYEGLYYDDATALGVSIGYFAQDSLYYRIVEIKKNSAEIGGYLIVGSSAFSGLINKRDYMDGYGYRMNTRLGVGGVTGDATTLTFSSYSLYSSLNMPTSSYSKPSGVSNNTYYGRNTPSKTFYPLTTNIYRNGSRSIKVACTMASYGWQQLTIKFYDGDGLELSSTSIGSMCQTTVQTISATTISYPKDSRFCVIGIIPDSGYSGYWGGWKNVTVSNVAEDGSASIELCDSSDNMIARLDVASPKYQGGIARIRVQNDGGTSSWFELSASGEIIGPGGNTLRFANDGLYYNDGKLAYA